MMACCDCGQISIPVVRKPKCFSVLSYEETRSVEKRWMNPGNVNYDVAKSPTRLLRIESDHFSHFDPRSLFLRSLPLCFLHSCLDAFDTPLTPVKIAAYLEKLKAEALESPGQ